MDKRKKYIIIGIIVLGGAFATNLLYACTYVGNRTVLYPKDEYSFTELIANKILGYNKPLSINELKERDLISEDKYILSKTKTTITWSKSELETSSLSEIKEDFSEVNKKHQDESNKITLDLYINFRNDYLNAENGTLKETLKELLKKQIETDGFLVDWELEQPDCILEELNN
ncbi:hypothetical protein H8S20_01735 [Clostridium sp. NSJ-6]|uniref:Lipoprotein n=1 Tax=Clostridium hominis TaxID=2763036 RepID=A0ABR7D8B9_9CLOT|nr:hypothetical protein [Clostridium hominis]MBC5627609.1 hypothetical protein [Clostridium hominis]